MDERLRFVAGLLEGEKMAPPVHRPRRAGSVPPGETSPAPAATHDRHHALAAHRPVRALVRGLQGEFMLGNRRYCYPLAITDFASRYLLKGEALSTTQEKFAFTVFEGAFKEFGLPAVIRTDNGVPFASAHALYGLTA